MKLRGRFTLTFALAALVPITVAAVVTRETIADNYRRRYLEDRKNSEDAMGRALARISLGMGAAVKALADRNLSFVGNILTRLETGVELDRKLLEEQGTATRNQLGFATLTVTDPDDTVIVSPHLPNQLGHPRPEVRRVARATAPDDKAYFVLDEQQREPGSPIETVLVVKAAHIAKSGVFEIAVSASRALTPADLDAVRLENRVDARIVDPDGKERLAPRAKSWPAFAGEAPIRIELPGPDGKAAAFVEIDVSDGGLDRVLRELTFISAGLALVALGVVVLIGLLVARRTARDLDVLVEGSLAASRGDLDHRVPVRSNDEIGAVASAFNFMMEDLRTSKEKLVIAERIAAWQDIARRLAHEIKNPLTPIQMAMDTLRKTWKKQHPSFDEILEESTATVLQEADRLKHIVAEFSDFARMPKPEFQRIDLNEVIRSSLSLYQGAAPIEISLLDQLPTLDADKGQVSQVVLNLVENARDAIGGRPGGKVSVTTGIGEAGDRAVFIVEDNGPGVPPDLKDKVFAPYFTTKHGKGGTGLGLAIVHRIVSDHGGRIAVADRPGGGARFSIELPLRNGIALLASRSRVPPSNS